MLKNAPFINQGKLSDIECYSCLNNKNLRLSRYISKASDVLIINLVYGGLSNIDKKTFKIMYNNIDREINLNEIFEFVVKITIKVTYRLR